VGCCIQALTHPDARQEGIEYRLKVLPLNGTVGPKEDLLTCVYTVPDVMSKILKAITFGKRNHVIEAEKAQRVARQPVWMAPRTR
jgi:hypothetical protein